MHAAQECGIVQRLRSRQSLLDQVSVDVAIHGVPAAVDDRRQFGTAWPQRWFVNGDPKGESFLPGHVRAHPGSEQPQLIGIDTLAIPGRHLHLGIRGGYQLEKIRFLHVARLGHLAIEEGLAGIDRESALGLVSAVARDAMLPQDRDDLVRKIDRLGMHGSATTGQQEDDQKCPKTSWGQRPRGQVALVPVHLQSSFLFRVLWQLEADPTGGGCSHKRAGWRFARRIYQSNASRTTRAGSTPVSRMSSP